MSKLSRKEKKLLRRILIAAGLLLFIVMMTPYWESHMGPFGSLYETPDGFRYHQPFIPVGYLIAYLIVGWDVVYKAIRNIRNGQVFDENFLMTVATIGAFATAEYAEAVFVMLFYQTGELFQDYAVGKSRKSIAALMAIRPDTANLETENGETEEVDPEDVEVGAVIVVKPGERVPLDGVVLSGASSLDTAALTGESLPRDVTAGDTVISGCVNQTGLLRVQSPVPARNPPCPRFWKWWSPPARKKRSANSSSLALPVIIPPASFSPQFCWQPFRRCLWETGEIGSIGLSFFWSSPAPARWSFPSLSAFLAASAAHPSAAFW